MRQFSPYHYRISEQLDLFANERNREWKWRDIRSGVSGHVWPKDLHSFVPAYLKAHPAPKPEYLEIAADGWWICPMPNCPVRMRDDGTAKAAKEQAAHLEGHP